jgi:hypothetical protein
MINSIGGLSLQEMDDCYLCTYAADPAQNRPIVFHVAVRNPSDHITPNEKPAILVHMNHVDCFLQEKELRDTCGSCKIALDQLTWRVVKPEELATIDLFTEPSPDKIWRLKKGEGRLAALVRKVFVSLKVGVWLFVVGCGMIIESVLIMGLFHLFFDVVFPNFVWLLSPLLPLVFAQVLGLFLVIYILYVGTIYCFVPLLIVTFYAYLSSISDMWEWIKEGMVRLGAKYIAQKITESIPHKVRELFEQRLRLVAPDGHYYYMGINPVNKEPVLNFR